MSTKTTFKRIALVAVAALGLGVLSVAPSNAAAQTITVTVDQNGTASLTPSTGSGETGTAAIVSVSSLLTSGTADSLTVEFIATGTNPTGASVRPVITFLDTLTASSGVVTVTGQTGAITKYTAGDSYAVGSKYVLTAASGSAAVVTGKFGIFLDSATASVRKAGTYNYSVITSGYSGGALNSALTVLTPVTITIAAAAADSEVASAANTTAFIGPVGTNTADAAVSAEATIGTTPVAEIDVTINNASGTASIADDSVTATVSGAGVISFDNTTYGKSITYSVTGGSATISIRGDGTAGVGTITVTTKAGFSTVKTVNFYAKAAKTITAAVAQPVLAIGSNAGAVSVSAVDAAGINWTGTAYIVASSAADALVAGSATTPVQCAAWNAVDGILCPVTALTAGTAKFKVIDAATVALATATSNEVTVTVKSNPVASVKIAFDKATYAPFEKAMITVTPLDKDGNTLQGASRANILATGGITTNVAFGSLSDTLTATTIETSKTTGTDTTAGAKTYVVYMPAQGDVTITATGGTALPLTGQVKVTATASIVNSSVDAATDAANEATDAANAATDAALAAADAADAATAAAQDASDAVAALSASVSKMISNLRAQITSLTNLVIKIQKKVKA